jgi:hypothetical protein
MNRFQAVYPAKTLTCVPNVMSVTTFSHLLTLHADFVPKQSKAVPYVLHQLSAYNVNQHSTFSPTNANSAPTPSQVASSVQTVHLAWSVVQDSSSLN